MNTVTVSTPGTTGAEPAQAHAAGLNCFHCGLPVPAGSYWQVRIDSVVQPMCCPGCEAVAQSIVDSGFGEYYRNREGFAATAGADSLVPPELLVYDKQGFAGQVETDAQSSEATLSVEGIRCAACVWLIERHLSRLPGVQNASLNVATERLHVRWTKDACKPSDIVKSMREIGYAAYPFDPVRHGAQLDRAKKTLFRQLFIAGLSMMQVMMYAFPVYLATDGTMDKDMAAMMQWASMLLTLPAILYSARPFFKGAWANLKSRMLGMDVPVALGIAAAFGGSMVATLRGVGEVYYDSVTMFIFLLLCSRYLELTARRKAATALDALQHALPASALRMAGYPDARATELIAAGDLCEGDVILVRPGEAIAADGVILEGDTTVDLALLTGESQPQRKTVGASLPGGAVNASQPIVLRIARPTRDSTLSVLMQLIERAGQGKPQIALWADQVGTWFVGALLLFAIAVFVAWQWFDPARAWPIAIAVLVVSCPCALSLATPTALAAATDRLLRQGVLVVQAHVLETLHRATHIIFDKTGTLTAGMPVVRHMEGFSGADPARCLQIAAALEASSTHPLGKAIIAAALAAQQAGREEPVASEVQHVVGQGLDGSVGGIRYRLGCAEFAGALLHGVPAPAAAAAEMTSIYLATSAGWLARFDLADGLRSEAAAVVKQFQDSGKQVILLSGDQQDVTRRVADELGIATALGQTLPDQKLAYVQALQAQGAIVAMVGDGINDAAVLRAADVSFAMGGGTALAQMNADCVLLSGHLSALAAAADTAAQTIAVIRQNLAWAMLYNAIAIPAAALGLLNPWLSGIGMSVSSAIVVLNALRLRRIPAAGTDAGSGNDSTRHQQKMA